MNLVKRGKYAPAGPRRDLPSTRRFLRAGGMPGSPATRSLHEFVTRAIGIHPHAYPTEVRYARLAEAMRRMLRCSRLLTAEQMIPAEGDAYRTVLLWSDARFNLSLLALVWRSGQRTPIHNHHAACIVGLYCGAERETRYVRTTPGAETVIAAGETNLRAGMISVVSPDEHEIHRVEAVAPGPAVTVSLHFYETDVTRQPGGSSIRERFVELAGGHEGASDRRVLAAHN